MLHLLKLQSLELTLQQCSSLCYGHLNYVVLLTSCCSFVSACLCYWVVFEEQNQCISNSLRHMVRVTISWTLICLWCVLCCLSHSLTPSFVISFLVQFAYIVQNTTCCNDVRHFVNCYVTPLDETMPPSLQSAKCIFYYHSGSGNPVIVCLRVLC